MELNLYDWHKRPDDCHREAPCTVCGCPPEGTRKSGAWHRATLQSEGETFQFRFILRKPGPTGWQTKGLCPIPQEPADEPAQPAARGANLDLQDFARQLFGQPEARGEIPAPSEPGAENPRQPEPVVFNTSTPGETTLNLMARAAVLYVMRKGFPEIEEAMKLKRRTIATWKNHWPEHWQMACQSAETQLVQMVKAQIGTPAILADVETYLERAERADQIATIIPEPAPDKPTLCTFFESYVLPTCFYDDKPQTIEYYRIALKLWRLITGDPPIDEITAEILALFRDALSKRRGRKRHTKAATNTVASRLRAIQTILDKAGPPARRNRDAKGLIACAPWIRPPRIEFKLPRTLEPEVLKVVYDATAGMDWPQIPGIKAPAWWKSLLEVTYNTALRRRTLFEMEMDEIDWGKNCLRLKAERFKAGRPMVVHLNPAAMEALRRIRTNRVLIFPTDADSSAFYKHFHRLQDSAGIPRKEQFGLHVIRKTSATVLAAVSPRTAQLALGHANLTTTLNSYIDPTGIIGASLDAMPQPFGLVTP